MTTVTLADDEAGDLVQLLGDKLKEMLLEIAKTDDRDYRFGLVARHERLERVRRRLIESRQPDELWV